MAVFKKQVNVQCGIQCWYPHTFIMQPTAPLQRTADKATSKNLKFSFLENNKGAIRTDWKIYSCIFYHLCIMVTIFQVANSLSIFQQQYLLWHNTENRWKVIIYHHVKSKNHVTKRRFSNYFWFQPPVLQSPFTRWVNNKLK